MKISSKLAMAALLVVAGAAAGCGGGEVDDPLKGPDKDDGASVADLVGSYRYFDEVGLEARLELKADMTFTQQNFDINTRPVGSAKGTWRLDGADITFNGWKGLSSPDAKPTFYTFEMRKGGYGIFGGEGEAGTRPWFGMSKEQ